VAEWRLNEGPLPPGRRADWTAEAMALRPHHNLTRRNCVEATAPALRKSILREDLERVPATLPPFATEFRSTPGIDPATLGPSVV
jgi:hypothetical protein